MAQAALATLYGESYTRGVADTKKKNHLDMLELDELFSLHPNPAQNKIRIDVQEKNDYTIFIYNEQGQLILQQKNSNFIKYIDISNIDNGIYFVNLKMETGAVSTKKLVILK